MSKIGRTRRQGGISELDDPPAKEGRRSGSRSGYSESDRSGFSPGGVNDSNALQHDSQSACALERSPRLSPCLHRDHSAQASRHVSWQLPLRDDDRVDRVVADKPSVQMSAVPSIAKDGSHCDPPGAMMGASQASTSCRESDRYAHLFGFSRAPQCYDARVVPDGAAYSAVLRSECAEASGYAGPSDTV
jgi:hypothetical protein